MAEQTKWDRSTGTDRQQVVTASALVRQFGIWQERAAKAPVYILHRGRPRLVLTSTDLMQALCVPQDSASAAQADIEALFESMREIVILVDQALRVTRISRAAKRYFGIDAAADLPLDRLAPGAAMAFVAESAHRVIERGVAETIEVAALRREGRRQSVEIEPWGDGAALFASDVTTADDLRDASAHSRAVDQSLAAISGAATARINLRGYLEHPTPSLAALTGIPADTLATVRFVTLLDIGSRVAVAEAIEAVIADGTPRGVTAAMPVNRGAVRSIRIGLSLIRRGVAPDAVAATLIGEPGATAH